MIVALTVGLAAHLLHVGSHAGHDGALSAGIYHWLRDSALAIPIAALTIYAVNDFTRSWTSTRPLVARLRWGLMVGLGYAFVLVPGGMAHGRLFPAEAHTGDAFKHALADAVALLPASVYTGLAIAFLLGMSSEPIAPVIAAFRRVRAYEWGTVTWKPAPGALARTSVALAAALTILPAPAIADLQAAIPSAAPDILADTTMPADCSGAVTADVVALDQPFYYNRLGALNANGMMYALARDVVTTAQVGDYAAGTVVAAVPVESRSGLEGNVTLRPDKRPRPLTLRVNQGDCLDITFTNLLTPGGLIFDLPADFPTGDILGFGSTAGQPGQINDQPLSRTASIHVDGMELFGDIASDGSNVGANAPAESGLVGTGQSTRYTYLAAATGTHLMYDMGNTLGGEGNGSTRSFGLFGAINVEPGASGTFDGAEWYRSQVTREEMDWAASAWVSDGNGGWAPSPGNEPQLDALGEPIVRYTDGGHPYINWDAVYPADTPYGKGGLPILRILRGNEIVHADLNAIIDDRGYPYLANKAYPTRGTGPANPGEPFREFTVIFHDEAFGVQAFPGFYNDPILSHTLHGVADSFPINYGSGGIGSEIIANRLGVGPMWDCAECKYEEFFLTSFTVGDPAMIVDIPANTGVDGADPWLGPKATKALYPEDPSNVHHAYLGDRVIFRNLHAGPKEHHIFHLHAHQWLFNPQDPQSNYLDGQALGPGAAYSYEIAYGGSGNRNLTPGDAIFHCHFYPHFAQGMWELWRVHDTFERGTLLDGEGRPMVGTGTPGTDGWTPGSRALPDGEIVAGTPIPGVVPMPGIAMAPMPFEGATVVASDLDDDGTSDSSQFDANGDGIADIDQDISDFLGGSVPIDLDGDGNNDDLDGDGEADLIAMTSPGYPWFTPGLVGHRPPTPALDLADVDGDGQPDDGGLPRHVITSGPDEFADGIEVSITRLDFNKVLKKAAGIEIPEDGTAVEKLAMAFHAQQYHDSYLPAEPGASASTATAAVGVDGFETNGLLPQPGAPFADPCRTDPDADTGLVEPIETNQVIKGANIEMPITLNKVGWHFQQQRFEALWEDVIPTLTNERAPQPMVMRLNSTDCAEFWHTNLVPNVYELDDYQVRTPTDIIGQHIHLVKFDVMSADGAANGWNYEDGTLSPEEVQERIHAFEAAAPGSTAFIGLDGNPAALEAEPHPYFCTELGTDCANPASNDEQSWLGARTTIQRWYADPLLERSWDGGVGTVFTHDHYGPSTHQQVGLYSTLLVEPEDSAWLHNETGEQLGTRADGGPSGWQAIIVDCAAAQGLPQPPTCDQSSPDFDAHREFYFEFADFQHAYEAGGGALGEQFNENPLGPSEQINSYADFEAAINPSFRLPPAAAGVPGTPEDLFAHPNWCPGEVLGEVLRPCPEAISADDPGTYALNFRNEPIGLRVFNGGEGAGAGQTPGLAGDLAHAYQSRTDRAIAALNSQPAGPYPPLTADIRPGDPWTPLLRVYMGDKVRIRVQVGAHEEEHNFTIPGLKWRQEPNSPNSGWKNSEFFGIDEYFNLDVPIVPDTQSGSPFEVDYIYTVGAELEGMWNGVWGILRSYGSERNDLAEVPAYDVGKNGYVITNDADYNGICPVLADIRSFDVTAVRAVDVLGDQGIVYNSRAGAVIAPPGGTNGIGPLVDPTALMYVLTDDLVFDDEGRPIGLQPGAPVEPLILRANAGDCIQVDLTNALLAHGDPDLSNTEMPGFNALPPIVHKDHDVATEGQGGILSFNANDLTPSSYVGLTPQLLAFDPRTDGGFSTGQTTGKLVAPGESERYTWYAGDVRVSETRSVRGNRTQFTLEHTPVEFGTVGLMPADRVKGTESGFVGAMVIEPEESTWIEDPGTRTQATVFDLDGNPLFRDFVVIMQNDINLRYAGGDCTDPATLRTMQCAVPSIAAEGPLGIPEDPQDSGQKAINYTSDPLWYRLGITPDKPFGAIHRDTEVAPLIPDVFSNYLDFLNVDGTTRDTDVGDDQVPVFRASPTGPQEGRFRVLMPGGHARGTTWTLHGHQWARQPTTGATSPTDFDNGSSVIGYRSDPGSGAGSQYYGTQEGINPTGHWNFVVDLGGHFDVTGDYLLRDQASFGSYQGLWGILRFEQTPPVAGDGQFTVPKYADPIVIDLLDLGFDLDGLGGAVPVITTQPGFGTLSAVDVDGTVSYRPGDPTSEPWADCAGADPFTCEVTFGYTITDSTGKESNEGAVTVLVTNTAPVAINDLIEIVDPDTDGSVDVLLNDLDAEGDVPDRVTVETGAVTAVAFTTPGLADPTAFSVTGSQVTYTVPDAVTDPVGIVKLAYTVTDESGAVSNNGSVRVTINADEIAITRARFQEANGTWSVSGTCTVPGASITVIDGPTIDGQLDPSQMPHDVLGYATCEAGDPIGTWAWSGEALNGAIPILGEDNFVSAMSSNFGFDEAFPVDLGGVNDPPVAMDDEFGPIDEDTVLSTGNVLDNDTDADGDRLSAVLETDVSNGTLVLTGDGTFTYTPNPGFNGSDSFTYRADDGRAVSEPATATIEVTAVPDAPVASDDLFGFATPVGAPTSYIVEAQDGVLANDTDEDGDVLTVQSVDSAGLPVVPNPSGAFVIEFEGGRTLTLNANGSFVYEVPAGSSGSDSFTYRATDGPLSSEPATVTLNVGLNAIPVAADDQYETKQNTELIVGALDGVLTNDADADDDELSAILVAGPSNGTLTLNIDGSFTYMPAFNFVGSDSFTYVANDGAADSNTATVTIDVNDVVMVTSAAYRERNGRWNIQGTVSESTSTIDVYLDSADGALIGTARVDAISGGWSFAGTSTVIPVPGSSVVAVSSSGGVSDPFTVEIR